MLINAFYFTEAKELDESTLLVTWLTVWMLLSPCLWSIHHLAPNCGAIAWHEVLTKDFLPLRNHKDAKAMEGRMQAQNRSGLQFLPSMNLHHCCQMDPGGGLHGGFPPKIVIRHPRQRADILTEYWSASLINSVRGNLKIQRKCFKTHSAHRRLHAHVRPEHDWTDELAEQLPLLDSTHLVTRRIMLPEVLHQHSEMKST